MRAEIVTIGDELCRGEIVDTNSSYLAARLWDADITTRWMTSCLDDDADIAAAIELAVTRADVVVCSGGLGPTTDDRTVEVVARLAGVGTSIDAPARARMEQFFAGRVAVTEAQLRQVRVPAGARVFANSAGFAPGFEARVRGVPVICLPGVPRELYAIYDGRGSAPAGSAADRRSGVVDGRGSAPAGSAADRRSGVIDGRGSAPAGSAADRRSGVVDGRGSAPAGSAADRRSGVLDGRGSAPAGSDADRRSGVLDGRGSAPAGSDADRRSGVVDGGGLGARLGELREAGGQVERVARRIYRAFGRGESQIGDACRGLVDGVPGASIHYQVKFPETLVKLVVRDRDAAAAAERLESLDPQLRERLRGFVYGTGDDSLVEVVGKRLQARGATVATAESCTGGMLGELLTRLPGSSKSFFGGAIVYTNAEKTRQLGVSPATIAAHGAVSEETVREMASGARDRFGVDLAVAISGVAGPDGGTPAKPVGTVWLALASASGVTAKRIFFPAERDRIRLLSAWWGLHLIGEALS